MRHHRTPEHIDIFIPLMEHQPKCCGIQVTVAEQNTQLEIIYLGSDPRILDVLQGVMYPTERFGFGDVQLSILLDLLLYPATILRCKNITSTKDSLNTCHYYGTIACCAVAKLSSWTKDNDSTYSTVVINHQPY